MVKGNSTFIVSERFPDEIYPVLKGMASSRGLTISEYIKQGVMKSCKSVNIVKPVEELIHDVNIVIPKYDRTKHKEGDVVLIQRNGKWVKVVVPQVDADGYVEWEDWIDV